MTSFRKWNRALPYASSLPGFTASKEFEMKNDKLTYAYKLGDYVYLRGKDPKVKNTLFRITDYSDHPTAPMYEVAKRKPNGQFEPFGRLPESDILGIAE